jgi:CBS domain-containing protein
MTRNPVTIAHDESLSRARRMMLTYRIRHLPVVYDGRLVGILSQRDLYRFDSPDLDQDYFLVEKAMTKDAYAVTPRSPLREAAAQMAERRCGAAVVVDGQRVVGLLTATDALRALAVVIEEHSSRGT